MNCVCVGCTNANLSRHQVFSFSAKKRNRRVVCAGEEVTLHYYIGNKMQYSHVMWHPFHACAQYTTHSSSKVAWVSMFPWRRQQAQIMATSADSKASDTWREWPTAFKCYHKSSGSCPLLPEMQLIPAAKRLTARRHWCTVSTSIILRKSSSNIIFLHIKRLGSPTYTMPFKGRIAFVWVNITHTNAYHIIFFTTAYSLLHGVLFVRCVQQPRETNLRNCEGNTIE